MNFPAAPEGHDRAVRECAVPGFPKRQIVRCEGGVGIGRGAGAEIDDGEGTDEVGSADLVSRDAAGLVVRGVQVCAGMLGQGPGARVPTVALEGGGAFGPELALAAERRKGRRERVREIDDVTKGDWPEAGLTGRFGVNGLGAVGGHELGRVVRCPPIGAGRCMRPRGWTPNGRFTERLDTQRLDARRGSREAERPTSNIQPRTFNRRGRWMLGVGR
jgi:hypothetical protein